MRLDKKPGGRLPIGQALPGAFTPGEFTLVFLAFQEALRR